MTITYRTRVTLIILLGVLSTVIVFSLPPIPQDSSYHHFVDIRKAWGIPNFGDVMGNLAFIVAGVWGMVVASRKRQDFPYPGEFLLWIIFFFGSVLVAFGSGYYHLNPNNATLVWDRLPMTIAFMSLFSLMIMERINPKAGLCLFPLLLIIGIGSVIYWNHTENLGQGDLRLYALVQFFPMIAILLMLWLFPARYSGAKYLIYTLGWYGLAKVLEHYDKEIFSMMHHTVSGHTLKHLAAAAGVGCLVLYVARRKDINL